MGQTPEQQGLGADRRKLAMAPPLSVADSSFGRLHAEALGFFNLDSGYERMLEVEILACALYMCNVARSNPPKGIKEDEEPFLHSFVRSLLLSFGGGSLMPPLVGRPSAWLMLDTMVPLSLLAWLMVNKVPFFRKVYRQPIVQILGFALCEMFRVQTVFLLTGISVKAIGPTMYFDVPVVGPVIAGTLAGCSGLFLPFDKGLSALLQDPLPYNVVTAFLMALTFHVSLNLVPVWAPELQELGYQRYLRPVAIMSCVLFAPRMRGHLVDLAAAAGPWGPGKADKSA